MSDESKTSIKNNTRKEKKSQTMRQPIASFTTKILNHAMHHRNVHNQKTFNNLKNKKKK
jgi:hypothetical protein